MQIGCNFNLQSANLQSTILMRLYIETMNAVLVDMDAEGRVRFDSGEWSRPSVQERRAIIHAAQEELLALEELLEILQAPR